MNLKTEYTYQTKAGTEVTVILENACDWTELTPQKIMDHVESIYKITGCPKAPTDKEMEDMEAYFSEDE